MTHTCFKAQSLNHTSLFSLWLSQADGLPEGMKSGCREGNFRVCCCNKQLEWSTGLKSTMDQEEIEQGLTTAIQKKITHFNTFLVPSKAQTNPRHSRGSSSCQNHSSYPAGRTPDHLDWTPPLLALGSAKNCCNYTMVKVTLGHRNSQSSIYLIYLSIHKDTAKWLSSLNWLLRKLSENTQISVVFHSHKNVMSYGWKNWITISWYETGAEVTAIESDGRWIWQGVSIERGGAGVKPDSQCKLLGQSAWQQSPWVLCCQTHTPIYKTWKIHLQITSNAAQ